MFSLIFEGKGSGKVFAFGLFLFSSLPVLDRAGYGFFCSENGKKTKQNKPRCTWILKGLEEISGGILCSKNAVCRKSVSCETEVSTQDFLPPLGHVVHFSSSVTVLPAVLWVLSYKPLRVKQSSAECAWLSVACPHTKVPHLSAVTQVHSLVTSTADLLPTSSLLHSLLISHCDLTCHQSNNSLHH